MGHIYLSWCVISARFHTYISDITRNSNYVLLNLCICFWRVMMHAFPPSLLGLAELLSEDSTLPKQNRRSIHFFSSHIISHTLNPLLPRSIHIHTIPTKHLLAMLHYQIFEYRLNTSILIIKKSIIIIYNKSYIFM